MMWTGTLLAAAVLVVSIVNAQADEAGPAPASQTGSADWPQYCGPNRDSVVVNSPKLMDAWPKEGPPLVWKSDFVPGWAQGGCSGPAVGDGKVFVYATAKNPVGGGTLYKIVTPEVLAAAGWMADVPEELAKKIEEARIAKNRPNPEGWHWIEIKEAKEKEKELDDYLAKRPELDKYIKDFIATLKPEEQTKYGAFIRRRLCISALGLRGRGELGGISWEGLINLSKLEGVGHATLREWSGPWSKATHLPGLGDHLSIGGYLGGFLHSAWARSFTRTDTLVCLDAASGKILWKKEFPVDDEVQAKLNQKGATHNATAYLGLCGTPAVSDGKCYFGGLMGLYCLSAKDGALLWQAKRPSSNTSVLVANGVVYYCGAAYDGTTGQLIWKAPIWKGGEAGWGNNTPPSPWKSGGKTYIISGNGGDSICCLDPETGKDLWTLKVRNYSGFGPCNFAIRSGSDILVADNKAYRMTPTALEPLKTLESTETRSGFQAGVMAGDNYYAETGGGEGGATKLEGLCCWDFKTGDLKWSSPFGGTGFCAPPMVADGKMIVASGPGGQEGWIFNSWSVYMIKATPEKYVPLGSFAPGMTPWTPMAFAAGKLFVRTELGISCYDLVQHGPYLDKTVVTKDNLTFVFKQTGGGLVSKDEEAGLKDVVVTEAAEAGKPAKPPKPAKAAIAGETIVVTIKDVPGPFGISCGAANLIAGKDGKPLPAFGWDEARVLKFRTCFDNTIVLTSDLFLPQNGTWNAPATYAVAGATVTNAKIDLSGKILALTTEKPFKAGQAITLTYPRFHVDQGEAVLETLTFTAREGSAARFVKTDEATSGSWKGVYGAEGAMIVGDAAAATKCPVVVTPSRMESKTWVASTEDARAPQKSGEAKDRIAAQWTVGNPFAYFQIDLEFTDGKEHQVALYCLDWDKADKGRMMTVEVWDPWRNVVLADKQTVKEFSNGKYLVWNIKGHVSLRLQSAGGWFNAVASGLFFDPAGKASP
jgi:outer membrane protein assembly factor BamB